MATLAELEARVDALEESDRQQRQVVRKMRAFLVQLIESWDEAGCADSALRDAIELFGADNKPTRQEAGTLGIRRNRVPR